MDYGRGGWVLINNKENIMKQYEWISERLEAATSEETKIYLRGYMAGMHYVEGRL